jgi:hypothetical protein
MPRQAMLLPPERPQNLFSDDPNITTDDVPTTDDGLAAAFQQDVTTNRWRRDDQYTQYWTADELIPLTRDADVGEIFGTSRIESVSSRIEGLKKKLQDNDEAIASKAYPLWLFMFGTDEQPWDREDIDRFMNAHDMENFQPGLKQGVRGDVDVKTISGEVADIAEYLQFDLDYILTAMPMPKYTLGAFESQINQFVSRSQERDIQRQLKEARREMEAEFSEVVQEKAQEMFDLSDEDAREVSFKMGRPNEQGQEVSPNQNVIDYRGKQENTNGGGQNQKQQQEDGSGNENQGQQQNDEQEQDGETQESEEENIWTAELADPRFVGTNKKRRNLINEVSSVFQTYVDTLTSTLRSEYADAPRTALSQLPSVMQRARQEALSEASLDRVTKDIMESVVKDTLDTIESDMSLDYNTEYSFTQRNNVENFANNVTRSVEHAISTLGGRLESIYRKGVQNGEDTSTIVRRMSSTYSRQKLRSRARMITHMEMQKGINITKMIVFEEHDDVIGVQPINTCGEGTSSVCKNLCGCRGNEVAVGYFDEQRSLSDQWMEQADGEYIHNGFNPLPEVPPWHFGCDTELVPVIETDDGDELTHAPHNDDGVLTVEQLEEKYGLEVTDNGK